MEQLERLDSPDGRYYRFRTKEGEVVDYPSVTTILQIINKPYLIPWAVKLCCQHLEAHCPIGSPLTQETLQGMLAIGKDQHKKVLQDAAEFGKRAHHLVEQRILTGRFPRLTGEEARIQACCQRFEEWWQQQGFHVSAAEMVVHSRTHEFAGTLDALAYDREGQLTLLDLKTSQQYSTEYALQVAAYAHAYAECYEELPQRAVVVRIGREDAELELVPIAVGDLPMLFASFLAAQTLWSWKRNYKHSKKAARAAAALVPTAAAAAAPRAARPPGLSPSVQARLATGI
jgi:hypothetical protein